jgi:type IV pilus assembly protein PilX
MMGPVDAMDANANGALTKPLCHPHDQRERGVVLLVALLAVLALAMGAVALGRTLATDVAIGGNLALREHATLASTDAVERALAALFEPGGIADTRVDDIGHNYFASRQAGEDARGVPRTLQSLDLYPSTAPTTDFGEGVLLRHVIERLCLMAGAASADNCALSPPSIEAATGMPPPTEPPRTPYYRVTVRADAPSGAVVFVQALLGEEPSHHRLGWRVLDE